MMQADGESIPKRTRRVRRMEPQPSPGFVSFLIISFNFSKIISNLYCNRSARSLDFFRYHKLQPEHRVHGTCWVHNFRYWSGGYGSRLANYSWLTTAEVGKGGGERSRCEGIRLQLILPGSQNIPVTKHNCVFLNDAGHSLVGLDWILPNYVCKQCQHTHNRGKLTKRKEKEKKLKKETNQLHTEPPLTLWLHYWLYEPALPLQKGWRTLPQLQMSKLW